MKLSAFTSLRRNPLATPAIAIAVSLTASFLTGGPMPTANAKEFVVSSRVVSDVAATSSNYVGDISNSVARVGGESIAADESSTGGSETDGYSSGGTGTSSGAGMNERNYGQPDLFYNYYTQGYANRANAQMYVSPIPVPARVGHTYGTYQPFYPEEYLYWHKNRFHNYYDNGRGMNRTSAVYYAPPVRQAISNLYWNKIRLPR